MTIRSCDIIGSMKKIILASVSPRRATILKQIGINFKVEASNFKEKFDKKIKPHLLAQHLSLGKAESVAKKYNDAIIIAADTLIIFKGKIIGKPTNKLEAKKILKLLNGKVHSIITGFTILDTGIKKVVTKSVETKVYFGKMTDKEIVAYIASGEPLDKAGAYGIQEKGNIFVKKIEGDYFNVVGLPIYSLVQELKNFGVQAWYFWK